MGLYQGSFRAVGDAQAADVVILDALGNPVFGFDPSRPATATVVSVPSLTTDAVILASNSARKQFVIQNKSTKTLFVALGNVATSSLYTFLLAPNGAYESPLNGFTGDVHGIWSAVNGAALVTEVV